jgi:hypothetical protein
MKFSVEIPVELLADLSVLAKEAGVSMDDFVRTCLQNATFGMHITEESLKVLKNSIKFDGGFSR